MKHLQIILSLIRLGRMHFLAGGILLHLLGIMIARYAGASINLSALLWGQIAITATQLMTHYANDYFDQEADRANQTPTFWSGGSRVLVENHQLARTALTIAITLGCIALLATLILSTAIQPGWTTFLLLISGQALAWFYSAPPIHLHSRGLGELTTMIVVTLLTPLIGFYLQMGSIMLLPILAVTPLCCFQFAMLLSVEFPDVESDRKTGKYNLAVRWGKRSAKLYCGLILSAYAMLPFLIYAGLPSEVAIGILLLSPLGLWQIVRIWRGDWQNPARWGILVFSTIALLMATAFIELLIFIVL